MERKKQFVTTLSACALAAAAAFAPKVARADIADFSYKQLAGSFTAATSTTGTLSVVAQNGVLPLSTLGDVSRDEAPLGNAHFDFTSGSIGSAAVTLSFNVTGVNGSSASSTGTVLVKDVDGDTLSANLSGTWNHETLTNTAQFNGSLTNVLFSSTGTFNGSDGSSFSSNFPEIQPYIGTIISFVFKGWFNDGSAGGAATSFANKSSQVDAQIISNTVPSPASVVLGLVGLAPLALRRRVKG